MESKKQKMFENRKKQVKRQRIALVAVLVVLLAIVVTILIVKHGKNNTSAETSTSGEAVDVVNEITSSETDSSTPQSETSSEAESDTSETTEAVSASSTETATTKKAKEEKTTKKSEKETKAPETTKSEPKPVKQSLINTSTHETYETLGNSVKSLADKYSNMLTLTSAGSSGFGRNLYMLKLGTGSRKALVIGAMHAREHLTTKYLLKVIEDYCETCTNGNGMYGSYNVKDLLSTYTIYVIPCVNPDGLQIVYSLDNPTDDVSLSDRSEYKANGSGIDLNRNFPINWENVNNGVTSPSEYYFKGYSAGDAVESKALMSLCDANNFEFMISVHVRGNVIWWGNDFDAAGNDCCYDFAYTIAKATNMSMTSSLSNPNDYGGGFEDWFRYKYRKPGICLELVSGATPVAPCSDHDYAIFDSIVDYDDTSYALAAAMQYCK